MLDVGQVWEWSLTEDMLETYLLLRHVEQMSYYWGDASVEVWEALNLETAEIEFITPEQTAGCWIQLE